MQWHVPNLTNKNPWAKPVTWASGNFLFSLFFWGAAAKSPKGLEIFLGDPSSWGWQLQDVDSTEWVRVLPWKKSKYFGAILFHRSLKSIFFSMTLRRFHLSCFKRKFSSWTGSQKQAGSGDSYTIFIIFLLSQDIESHVFTNTDWSFAHSPFTPGFLIPFNTEGAIQESKKKNQNHFSTVISANLRSCGKLDVVRNVRNKS